MMTLKNGDTNVCAVCRAKIRFDLRHPDGDGEWRHIAQPIDDLDHSPEPANLSREALKTENYRILLHGFSEDQEANSNIMRHAKHELEVYGGPGYGSELDEEFNARVLDVMRIFTSMGHSGMSARIFSYVIHELMEWHNLTPLTDNPAEWVEHAEDSYQSTRRPDAFSSDGGKTYRLQDEGKWEDVLTWKSPFKWMARYLLMQSDIEVAERRHIEGPLHTSLKVEITGDYL